MKKGNRILFVGNSITLHGCCPEIGWFGEWGMAASSMEKDYVHLTMERVRDRDTEAVFSILQAADWERTFWMPAEDYQDLILPAKDFKADILIMRIGENCPNQLAEQNQLRVHFAKLIDQINTNHARVIVTTSFWKAEATDHALRTVARERQYTLIELGDLGEQACNKAVGQFENEGVAAHPGDLGMKAIADRIVQSIDL